jgi:coenzyme F420-reducing hydrogenase alpha subunit
LHLGGESDPTIVNPARLSARLSTDVCGSCHSVHTGHTLAQIEAARVGGFGFRPGDELEKTRNIVRAEEENRSPATRGLLEERPDYLEAHF